MHFFCTTSDFDVKALKLQIINLIYAFSSDMESDQALKACVEQELKHWIAGK